MKEKEQLGRFWRGTFHIVAYGFMALGTFETVVGKNADIGWALIGLGSAYEVGYWNGRDAEKLERKLEKRERRTNTPASVQ